MAKFLISWLAFYIAITAIWQTAEKMTVGEITPRVIDTVVGVLLSLLITRWILGV